MLSPKIPKLRATIPSVNRYLRWVADQLATGAMPSSVGRELTSAAKAVLASIREARAQNELKRMLEIEASVIRERTYIDAVVAYLGRRGVDLGDLPQSIEELQQ